MRTLLSGLQYIPQISHPNITSGSRSRYTHTRTICRAASLLDESYNKRCTRIRCDLISVLAMHDVGHPPYGHAGERIIQDRYDPGYSNTSQSLRFMFANHNHLPTRSGYYATKPLTLSGLVSRSELMKVVDLFDDLENAIGDSLDLYLLGEREALEMILGSFRWSIHVRGTEELSHAIAQIILSEFDARSWPSLILEFNSSHHPLFSDLKTIRVLIEKCRNNNEHLSKLDDRALHRIPILYEEAYHFCSNITDGTNIVDNINQMAIDLVTSTNDLDLGVPA